MMKVKWMVIILLASFVLTACSSSSKIVGTWEDQYGDQYEFYKDGTLVITSYGIPMSGSYEFIGSETIKLSFDGLLGLGGSSILDVKISGGELRLSSNGETLILKKMN